MRQLPSLLLVLLLAAVPAVVQAQPISDERPLLLSELATEVRNQAAASGVDVNAVAARVVSTLQAAPSTGASPIVLSGAQKAQLVALVQAAFRGEPAALQALDRFPGWNIPDVGKGLRSELRTAQPPAGPLPKPTRVVEALGIPAANQTKPTSQLKNLGHGIYRGDVYDPAKLKLYPDSKRLAEVLNRLSLDGTGWVHHKGRYVRTPGGLLNLLRQDGHSVEAKDKRSIANFSGLYYMAPGKTKVREVVAPVWLDTKRPVPGKQRTLLVPATHSELVISVRGPTVNADVAFYLGTDSQASFRATAWRRPTWTGSKVLRTFSGAEAVRAASAAGWVRRNLQRLSAERGLSTLRTGAYGQLGVCNDATALVEARLGLEASHWPLVRLREVYEGTGVLKRVSDAAPYDTDPDAVPGLERVIHSIPFVAGSVPDLFPTLAEDLTLVTKELNAARAGLAGVTRRTTTR